MNSLLPSPETTHHDPTAEIFRIITEMKPDDLSAGLPQIIAEQIQNKQE